MENSFEINPHRELPDGSIARTFPFHISLKGAETKVLCRDDEDYDAFVKIICVCCLRKNCILVIHSVVSNHAHFIVLSVSQIVADDCADEVKRIYSMYFSRKYKDSGVMKGLSAKALLIDSSWYLRNAIAYDIRNAMDNGAVSVQSYRWTGFQAVFCNGSHLPAGRAVNTLSKRKSERIMHTNFSLKKVRWMLDGDGYLMPYTICDWRYIEGAFNNNQAFFMRTIGSVNTAELSQKLVDGPRTMQNDGELLKTVSDICTRWFKTDIRNLSYEKKTRIIPYVYRIQKTNVKQLSRIFELECEKVEKILGKTR